MRGLVLECRSTGGKTFYLRYDHAGRQRQIKIAAYGDAPLAKIRKRAEELRAHAALGGDSSAVKAEARAVPTYGELAGQHLADAQLHQRSFNTTYGYMTNHVLPRWGRMRVTEIDPRAVVQWLAD